MSEVKYDDNGAVVRDFPVKMVNGDKVVFADTEAAVVQREWEGFQTEAGVKDAAAAEKATAKQEAEAAKAAKASGQQ